MNSSKMSLKSYGSWKLVGCLGAGAFGEVHRWKNIYSGQEIATKRLKPNPKLRPDEIGILHKRWSQEYQWMKNLATNYIVAAVPVDDSEFIQYLIRQSHVEHKLPVIIMQYCNGGDLRKHLNKIENMNGLTEHEVRCVLCALVNAIEYLHIKCNIEHRDIKPENIVIHIQGNKKFYKLADFGYAREIPEQTIAQSVVGTRNYVAPEVVDSEVGYTESVDYWSAGHVGYEIICGTLPFLPYHNSFVTRIEAIKSMPKNCINIVQKFENPSEDDFEYGYELPLNHCSPIFSRQIERWLSLSLDKNYKTRGHDNTKKLIFFSLLNEILNDDKILTVFSLKKYRKFYYHIKLFKNLGEFVKKVAVDNGIKDSNLFFIQPPLHPNTLPQKPSDYFVAEWCDTSNLENPPVMLYVTEYITEGSSHIDMKEHFSPYKMIKYMEINPEDPNIPPWFIKQFENEVHLLLTKEQHHLTCCMMGLQGYAVELERRVFYFQTEIEELNDYICTLQGHIELFSTLVDQVKQQNSRLPEATEARINSYFVNTKQLKDIFNSEVKHKYKLLLKKSRELAQPALYDQIIAKDIFLLKEYRSFLKEVSTNSERMDKAQRCIENCDTKFESFLRNKEAISNNINHEVKTFDLLQRTAIGVKENVKKIIEKVKKETHSLFQTCFTNNALSSQMHSINIDSDTSTMLLDSTNALDNPSLSLNSMNLIHESLELINSINQQCYMMTDSP